MTQAPQIPGTRLLGFMHTGIPLLVSSASGGAADAHDDVWGQDKTYVTLVYTGASLHAVLSHASGRATHTPTLADAHAQTHTRSDNHVNA